MAKKVKKRGSSKINNTKNNIPKIVKITTILFYIFSVLSILLGIMILIGSIAGLAVSSVIGATKIIELIPGTTLTEVIVGQILLSVLLFIGIATIALGVLEYFIGRELIKGKRWAYIFTVIIILVGLIKFALALFVTPVAILGLIIYGIIGYYFLIDKKVKKFFKQ